MPISAISQTLGSRLSAQSWFILSCNRSCLSFYLVKVMGSLTHSLWLLLFNLSLKTKCSNSGIKGCCCNSSLSALDVYLSMYLIYKSSSLLSYIVLRSILIPSIYRCITSKSSSISSITEAKSCENSSKSSPSTRGKSSKPILYYPKWIGSE